MRLWKIYLAAALLAFSPSGKAFAESTTILAAPSGYPMGAGGGNPYGGFNPYMGYAGPPMQAALEGNQRTWNNAMAHPQANENSDQQQQQKSYHYKAPAGSGAGIPQEELPQRIFHNVPQPIYGEFVK